MSEQRTEKATPRRLQKARQQGQFPVAREFVAGIQFLGAVLVINAWGRDWFVSTESSFHALLRSAFQGEMTVNEWTVLFRSTAAEFFVPLALAGSLLIAATLAAQLASTGLGFSLAKLAPSVKRFNPLSRLKELPHQNVTSVVQAVVLLGVMGWVVYTIVQENLAAFLLLPFMSVQAGIGKVTGAFSQLLWRMAAILLIFGFIDFFRQRRRFSKQLRMSKQEVRDEFKESEGNPQIKARIRRIQRDRRRRQMMADVAKATAVITNPTHYAVAIRYDAETMSSPIVVAKGKNYLARRIRERATENQVPIVENPPLARGLYGAVEVGQEIPAAFFRAVAEVLAYIYKLMGTRRPV